MDLNFKILIRELGRNFEILKDVVSFAAAVFIKFQNFKISAKFNLADLIASAEVRVKLRRS